MISLVGCQAWSGSCCAQSHISLVLLLCSSHVVCSYICMFVLCALTPSLYGLSSNLIKFCSVLFSFYTCSVSELCVMNWVFFMETFSDKECTHITLLILTIIFDNRSLKSMLYLVSCLSQCKAYMYNLPVRSNLCVKSMQRPGAEAT